MCVLGEGKGWGGGGGGRGTLFVRRVSERQEEKQSYDDAKVERVLSRTLVGDYAGRTGAQVAQLSPLS